MSKLEVSNVLLQRLMLRNNFATPNAGLTFFGIRGALPIDTGGTNFMDAHELRFATINFSAMRCTIGQWKINDDKVCVFPGSTVPSMPNIQRAKAKGGVGTNMLMLGFYEYVRGYHKVGKPSGHRAFRQNKFFPVWRNEDDFDYDLADRIDLGSSASYFWDNLHCAYHDNVETPGYSSAGCQVVSGQPKSPARNNKPETGPWKSFIDNAYNNSDGQTVYSYALFSATELGMVAAKSDSEISLSARFGSTGPLVLQTQEALIREGFPLGTPDGEFGRGTLYALIAFQVKEFGKASADGVLGPNTAAALEITLPKLSDAQAAPQAIAPSPAPDLMIVEADDESDSQAPVPPRAYIANAALRATVPLPPAPTDIEVSEDAEHNWTARAYNGHFYVGTSTRWSSYRGLYQSPSKLGTLLGGEYDAADWENRLGDRGAWAWFLLPTIIGESGGKWGRINTYDGAGLTFGPLQFASHTPNDNLILLFRRLLGLPEAGKWFPDLLLKNGQVHRKRPNGEDSLEDDIEGGRLVGFMEYLNPDSRSVGPTETMNCARLMAWSNESESFRLAELDLGIQRFLRRINRLKTTYGVPLQNHSMYRALWVGDILHHGRSTYPKLRSIFNSANPDAGLEAVGANDPRWAERVKTVKTQIHALKQAGRLNDYTWGQGPFGLT